MTEALDRVIRLAPKVEVRYFTDSSFHPKLYLFGTRAALVGSANLTQAAILSNQEVVVEIGSEDPRLNELATLFGDYWSQAKVLTSEVIAAYRAICAKFNQLWRDQHKLENEVSDMFGRVVGRNIARDQVKETVENLFLEDFRKTYQECVSAFAVIRRVYERAGKRKVPANLLPLRLEIDSFNSFVREEHASGESWMTTPLLAGAQQEAKIQSLMDAWLMTPWPYLEETIVHDKYPRLLKVFGAPASIQAASDDELFDALTVVHSFHDRLRFHLGGLPTWRKVFLEANDPKRVRDSLSYLLYGPGEIERRMADLIFSLSFKLNEFGQANVQELVGWINQQELPVINGRTTKVLRYFGFNVRQLQ